MGKGRVSIGEELKKAGKGLLAEFSAQIFGRPKKRKQQVRPMTINYYFNKEKK
jgi:hypothetical protein